MLYRPFAYCDRISMTEVTGTIVDVNFRYTVLAAGSDRIMVPKSTPARPPSLAAKPRAARRRPRAFDRG